MAKLKCNHGESITAKLSKITVRPLMGKGLVELDVSSEHASLAVELTARQAEDLALILPGAARDARAECSHPEVSEWGYCQVCTQAVPKEEIHG